MQLERLRLDQRFRSNRHQRERKLAIIVRAVHLVERRYPILPLAVADEALEAPLGEVGRADWIAQSERDATAQRVRHAAFLIEPVVARRAVHGQVRDVVAAPRLQEVVHSFCVGRGGAWRQHRPQQHEKSEEHKRVAHDRQRAQKPACPFCECVISGRVAGQRLGQRLERAYHARFRRELPAQDRCAKERIEDREGDPGAERRETPAQAPRI